MAYKKIGNNKYKITIELGYDILGKRKRKIETFEGNAIEVKIREAELIKEYYKKGNNEKITDLTFEEYGNKFIEYYCEKNISLITTKGYKQMLKKIYPLIGKYKLDKINSNILESMYQRIKMGTNGKELSNESMLHYYRLINVMFVQAIKWKLISSNPNIETKKPKKEKKDRKFYDLEQVNKLIKCLENENIKYKTLILLALDSGARRSEICALKWSDVNFDTKELLIDNSLKIINGKVDEKNAKTSYSVRKIYLSDTMIDLLKEYKIFQDKHIQKMGGKWKNHDRIFTSKEGKHIHPDTCSKIINKIVKKYNLPEITFHSLRHTNASVLLASGINAKAISQRLGHSSTDITLNIYTHAFDSTKKESAEIINNVLKKC